MAISPDELVGYLRAESNRASRWRLILLIVQFLATVPAALLVVVSDPTYSYFLALAAPFVILIWWLVKIAYLSARDAENASRRASLILGGLGENFSPEEYQRLRQKFTVSEAKAQDSLNANYYASTAKPSYARLGEMLEESAFYSKKVHEISAIVMGIIFGLFILIAGITALVSLPFAERITAILLVRIGLASFVFLLSSDVLGAMYAHRRASRLTEDVQIRMAASAARSYPRGDVLLAMTDYNNAMESAPEGFPGVFRLIESNQNKRWTEYKQDRDQARRIRSNSP